MPSNTDAWGIEIGSGAVKAVRLQRSGKEIVLTDHEVIPHKKVLTTPDIDVDETIRLGLDQFLTRHSMGNSAVVVSVPAHMAFARFAKLPPVEPKRVPDIVRFEAVQQIPFPIDQVEWDYQIFESPDSPDVEVGIFAITRERVNQWLENFKSLGVQVHGVTLASLGVFNALQYDLDLNEDAPGTILMDIGATATDLIIVNNGQMWLRTIPIGGHHFTETLVRSFKLSYTKAESIKRDASNSKYARQIFQAMRPVFVELVNEVQKSLGYYQSLQRDVDLKRLIGIGNTFRLPGLQKFLSQQLQIDVARLDRLRKVDLGGGESGDQSSDLVTPYGLALQGIEAEAVSANILPQQMIRAQVWKKKQPWLVAATVVIAAGAGFAAVKNGVIDRGAFQSNEQVRQNIRNVISQAQAKKTQWDSIEQTDPRAKIANLQRVLDYRDLWPGILGDIQEAVAAAAPQSELLSGDPEAIKSVPRPQRRQIFINEMTSEYVPGTAEAPVDPVWGESGKIQAEQAAASSVAQAARASGLLNSARGGPSAAAISQSRSQGRMQAGLGPGGDPRSGMAPQYPPSFNITLRGRTPRFDGPQFLTETIKQHLEGLSGSVSSGGTDASTEATAEDGTNTATNDSTATTPTQRVSYRVASVDIANVQPVQDAPPVAEGDAVAGTVARAPGGVGRGVSGGPDAAMIARREAQNAAAMSSRGGDEARTAALRNAGLGGGAGGGVGGIGGTNRSAQVEEEKLTIGLGELEPHLPSSAFAKEDTSTDWQFEIKIRVELVMPNQGTENQATNSVASAER